MTEPVGNIRKRSTSLPGSNSLANREAVEEEVEPVRAIVAKGVHVKKPNVFRRAMGHLVAEDLDDVGAYMLSSVVFPSTKRLIYDVIQQGAHLILFGNVSRTERRSSFGFVDPRPSSVLRRPPMESRFREPDDRFVSRSDRTRHNFSNIVLDNHQDAVDVLEALEYRISKYGRASVGDLYGFLGVTASFPDQQYGWTDISGSSVEQNREGFYLRLPNTKKL